MDINETSLTKRSGVNQPSRVQDIHRRSFTQFFPTGVPYIHIVDEIRYITINSERDSEYNYRRSGEWIGHLVLILFVALIIFIEVI